MIKRLAKCIREYKLPTIITLLLMVGEAVIETSIPFITANLVNKLKAGAEMREVLTQGLILAGMAIVSLSFGGIAGFTCARASAGFAKNLRHDIFNKIQSFTFMNIHASLSIFPDSTIFIREARATPGAG